MLENRIDHTNTFEFGVIDWMIEGIIEPYKIKIRTTNPDELNRIYGNSVNFIRTDKFGKNQYKGKSKENGSIIIEYGSRVTTTQLEAIVGHELVHKSQHRKSQHNFSKKKAKEVQQSIELQKQYNKEIDPIKQHIIYQKSLKLHNYSNYNTTEEKMAYAYQLVKLRNENNFTSESDVIEEIQEQNKLSNQLNLNQHIELDIRMKKYIFMYWSIKDML